MSNTASLTFYPNRPVFVKSAFQGGGKFWKPGDRYNWEFIGVPYEIVQQLFYSDLVHHNPEKEVEVAERIKIGDGLEEYTIEELEILVSNINAKVKLKTKTTSEFLDKKCPSSKIKDKQIGKIRSWRLSYGHLEND